MVRDHSFELTIFFHENLWIWAMLWLHVWKNKASVFEGISYVPQSQFLIGNNKKITFKVGTIAQVFSVSIKTNGFRNKKRVTILIKTYVSVLLSEHTSESRSFNRFQTIFFNWWAVNYCISPRHANSPEWLLHRRKYSAK